jgi:hypothetical protein
LGKSLGIKERQQGVPRVISIIRKMVLILVPFAGEAGKISYA